MRTCCNYREKKYQDRENSLQKTVTSILQNPYSKTILYPFTIILRSSQLNSLSALHSK